MDLQWLLHMILKPSRLAVVAWLATYDTETFLGCDWSVENRLHSMCLTSCFGGHLLGNFWSMRCLSCLDTLDKSPETCVDYARCGPITEPFRQINSLQEVPLGSWSRWVCQQNSGYEKSLKKCCRGTRKYLVCDDLVPSSKHRYFGHCQVKNTEL